MANKRKKKNNNPIAAIKEAASAAERAASKARVQTQRKTGGTRTTEPVQRKTSTKKRTQPKEQESFNSRMNRYRGDRVKGNPRKQLSPEARKKLDKTGGRIATLTKGNLQTIQGAHATTFNAIRDPYQGQYTGEANNSPYQDGSYGQLLQNVRSGAHREENLRKASKKIEEGEKNIKKATKDLGAAGKFAADLYGAGLGMLGDAAAGPLATTSLMSRSFGGAYDRAKKEGADDSQAAMYGIGVGGLEAASEKLFAVAAPLRKVYGAGAGDALTDKVLKKLVSKAGTEGTKNAVYHGGKVFGSALTEALEEMVVEGIEPSIANKIYADAVGTPHETSAKDVLYSGLLGGTMGGLLGGAGQVVEYGQGKKVQNIFGDDGVKALAKTASQVDDAAESAKGAAINEMINRGDGIAAGQASELYKAVYSQEIKDLERSDMVKRSAEAVMQREKLISPIDIDAQSGETTIRKHTLAMYNEQRNLAASAANRLAVEVELQLPEMSVRQISDAVAAIQTGIGGINEVNLFTVGNPEARTIYTAVTGKELPNTNKATREMLFEEIGKNRVASARLETEGFKDEIRGLISQDMSHQYEVAGQEAFAQAFSDAGMTDAAQVGATLQTFDDFYKAGRNDMAYGDVAAVANPVYTDVPSGIKRAAWQAGQQDKILAADMAQGLQIKIGEAARKNRSNRKSGGRGRLYSEISRENRSKFTASQQAMYRMLARTFGIDIHVVDSLESGANGEYHDGAIYLSMSSDRALEYVFAHEITHHMQDYAPQEYNQLKELVRTRWAQRGGIDDAIDAKVAQYAQHDVNLGREQALDEIIADSTYETLQDEGFIDEITKTHRNVAQALLDAIKEVLRKLRLMIAGGDRFTPAQNEALLTELDILKEFESMWADGLMRAAENKAAVGKVDGKKTIRNAYSLMEFEDGKRYVEIDGDTSAFDGLAPREQGSLATKIIKNKFAGKVIGLDNRVFVNCRGAGEYGFPVNKLSADEHDAKMRSAAELDNLMDAGFNFRNEADGRDGHIHNDVVGGFDYFDTIFKIGNRYFQGTINIKNVGKGKLFKDITKIKDVTKDISSSYGNNPKSTFLRTSSVNSIPNNSENSKTKFSLKDTIEETHDLIAQHNVSADNLKKAFDLGGFPMPSIAITKGDVGHTNFGEVSLIFDKATIDPSDSRNKVFGADAWTPTFPNIEYEINDKKASKIYAKANKAGHVPFLNPTDFHPSNMESRISNKGEQGLIEYYKDDYGLKQMYLVDIGEMPVGYVQTTVREEMSDIERREGQWYLDNEPELCESLAKARVDENPMKWRKDNIEKLRGAYKNYLVSEGLAEDAADEVANAATAYEVSKPLLNAEKIKNGKDVIERTENDFTATEKMIDKKINEEDYEKWFSELFSGIEKNSGVWNGKDPYTPSGNRRSFAATHYPVTLDNIVSAMLAQADGIRNSFSMFVGTKTIRAAATDQFDSIDGIRKASKKIQKLDAEEYNALKEELDSRLSAVMGEIVEANDRGRNQFMEMDSVGYAIEEACGDPTVENIKDSLEGYGLKATDAQAKEINEIINEVVDMPVNMFEAKPLRPVGFDEVKAAVVPNDIDADIKSGLSGRGVEIFEYESGNDADRIEKVNAVAEDVDVKFSFPDESDVIDYANEHEAEFVDVPPVRDYEKKQRTVRQQTYGELLAQVEKLRRDKYLTKGKVLDERSVREEVNNLISTLMTYSESYTVNGGRRKTNLELLRDGVHATSQIYTALKEGDIYEAIMTAEIAAEDIVGRLEFVNDEMFREYKELRDYLKNTRVVISEEDASSIPDFKDFRRHQANRIRIVRQNGVPVDVVYEELVERWPELFPADVTHPADQLLEMAEVRESLDPYEVMLAAEETEQLIKQTAQDLLDIAGHGKAFKSWADKKAEQYDERLRLVKARHKEALRDVKKNERDRAEKLLRGERQKWADRVNRANERADRRVQAEKEKAKAREENRKDAQTRRKYMASIESNRKWLADRILKPTDDKHIPEGFKAAVADLLSQMDMQTKKSKKLEEKRGERARRWVEMDELRARLAEIAKEDGNGEFEYDGYIFQIIDSMAEHMDGRAIDEAGTKQLHEFDILMKYIVANVRNYNKAFDESIKEDISQLGNETIHKASERQKRLKDGVYRDRSGALGAADRLLNESMVTPRDFFERLGGGLEKTFMAMRRGMDRHVDNIAHTRDFFDELFKPYRNKTAIRKRSKPGSELQHWRDDSQSETFKVQGGEISLSPAQIMSLYCLSKREQALGHIFGAGIVASRIDKASKIKKALGAKQSASGSTVMVSMEDVANIIGTLTPEQKEMADKLQEYLNNECAAWGNEVSMKMFGYRKFTEENYFPIKSADAYLDSNFEGRQATERIKNFGFTKGTVINANNPIMIDDVFSVVADHVNKMSLYSAFAAPMSDFMRVYNYKNRDDSGLISGSVKAAVEDAYGKKAINYMNNFMSDVNSQVQTRSEGLTRFVSKSLANYKKAAIGGNLRVAVQQPTAVVRAFTCISPKYFVNTNVNPVKNMRDMQAHCQIAKWKAWGFSQVDMARDIDDIMMNNEWSKVDAVTMEIYGALDNITWSSIWAAVRAETKAKYKDIEVDSEEFYSICNERASEIFDKTQVVDSVFNRSQAMRNADVMSKMLTSFMAEPTRTFNMMRTEYARAIELWHEGEKGASVRKLNRATSVFVLNAAAVSAAAAIADALRDKAPGDDDDDSWWANFWANFWGNVNPLNMIPMVKDIWGYTDGWGTQNMAMEGWEKLVQGAMNLAKNRDAESLKAFAEGLGYVTGLPIKNVMREVDSIFKMFGINVFAAEDGREEKKEKKSIFDSIFGFFDIKDGSWQDNLLNRFGINLTEEEKAKAEYSERISGIEEKLEGLSGEERQEKIWSEATENYTKYIKEGNFKEIDKIRRMLGELGGDVDKFDESVMSEVKTAYRKNIGIEGDPDKIAAYRYYLSSQGMTDAQISKDVVASSNTATEFQISVCMNDADAAVEALQALRDAGITYEDAYVLYVNRANAIKGKDFSTGELEYPVSGTITSPFGYRDAPTAGASSYHEGIDIGAPLGSDVAAADGGKISKVGWNGGKGYSVTIDHGNGRYTEYNHLNCYYVQKGDAVVKGQVIAAVGSTGISTGPHLDFRVRESGTYIDPMIYFR